MIKVNAREAARKLGEQHATNYNPEQTKAALASYWLAHTFHPECSFEDFCVVYHEAYQQAQTAMRQKGTDTK